MFSEFIFILCILHSFGDGATNSLTNNQTKININLNYKKLNTTHENLIDNSYQPSNEKYILEDVHISYKDTTEDVQVAEDSPIVVENIDFIAEEDAKIKNDLLYNKTTDSEMLDLYSRSNVFKSKKQSFEEIIKSIVINHIQSSAISAVNETDLDGDIDNVGKVIPHSGYGISYNSTQNTSEIALNLTSINGTKSTNGSHTKKATCLELDQSDAIEDVEIVNATTLLKLLHTHTNITSRSTPAECYLIYFFSLYCPFSTQGSAYVNALARSVPNIPVYGLNSVEYHSLNARYGIMGTPSLVLFHNGHTVGRYNASEYSTFFLESFIHHFTDQKIHSINVTSQDFKASLPSHTLKNSNIALYIAWAFLLIVAGYAFLNSEFYAKLTEAILNNWREAEAQHEHNE